jgi:serine/threonine-protein kinase
VAQETELGGYSLVGRLAVGGMAEVYQAKAKAAAQKSPGEPDDVVIKRLLPSYRQDANWVKQFVDEAKLTVRLRHPNIVRTFRCFKAGAAMPLPAATYITISLLKALDYIHRAKVGENGATIVHRDVNPANILLSIQGDVKLTDFGVAEVEGLMRGDAGALRGTIAYMSPEAVLGQAVDHRADLFAAGIIFWEMCTNERLFLGNSEMEMMHKVRDCKVPAAQHYNSELPEQAISIIRKALQPDKNLRFQTAGEFAKVLEILSRRNGWPTSVDALKPLLGG